MDLILNESQYQTILLENVKSSIEASSEQNKNLIKKIIKQVFIQCFRMDKIKLKLGLKSDESIF